MLIVRGAASQRDPPPSVAPLKLKMTPAWAGAAAPSRQASKTAGSDRAPRATLRTAVPRDQDFRPTNMNVPPFPNVTKLAGQLCRRDAQRNWLPPLARVTGGFHSFAQVEL